MSRSTGFFVTDPEDFALLRRIFGSSSEKVSVIQDCFAHQKASHTAQAADVSQETVDRVGAFEHPVDAFDLGSLTPRVADGGRWLLLSELIAQNPNTQRHRGFHRGRRNCQEVWRWE